MVLVLPTEMYRSHHDIEPLPNGNLLMIAWEYRSESEAAEAGKYPQDDSSRAVTTSSVWPDKIIEVKPIGLVMQNCLGVDLWIISSKTMIQVKLILVYRTSELLDVNYIDAAGSASAEEIGCIVMG